MRTTVVWQKGLKITYKKYPNFLLSYEETDQIGKEKGYGETIVMLDPAPFKGQLLTVVSDFVNGVRSKFPVCCVLNFCIDHLLGRPSAQLRWNDTTDYVECFLHARRHTKKAIPLDLY
jgi:hypothetical protein